MTPAGGLCDVKGPLGRPLHRSPPSLSNAFSIFSTVCAGSSNEDPAFSFYSDTVVLISRPDSVVMVITPPSYFHVPRSVISIMVKRYS